MITRFKINNLFGLYSYDIKWNTEDVSVINIITGPNGYGKTTIFTLINAFFQADFSAIADVEFMDLEICFDGKKFLTHKECIFEVKEGSDVKLLKDIKLTCSFYADETKDDCETFEYYKKDTFHQQINGSLHLLLQSQSCCYITDNRLFIVKDDREVTTTLLNEEVVENIRKSILRLFHRYDGKDHLPENIKVKLDMLTKIIGRSCFADKQLILDNYFGIRFRMNNTDHSFILPSQLSSGEKHILVQAYSLLFEAKDGTVALVDEPELSFHPAWLNQYVTNLQMIQEVKRAENKNLQIIIATHSPMLIGQRWDMCVDLYENRKK